jgi:hypothetical protein
MAGVTGQQRMLTPPWHLILPLLFPGICVSLMMTVDYSIYLIWALILPADFPFTWVDFLVWTANLSL